MVLPFISINIWTDFMLDSKLSDFTSPKVMAISPSIKIACPLLPQTKEEQLPRHFKVSQQLTS